MMHKQMSPFLEKIHGPCNPAGHPAAPKHWKYVMCHYVHARAWEVARGENAPLTFHVCQIYPLHSCLPGLDLKNPLRDPKVLPFFHL
jgi:hypothetical protein